jgi:hypothetical protein
MNRKRKLFSFSLAIAFLYPFTAFLSGEEALVPRISHEAVSLFDVQLFIAFLTAILFYRFVRHARKGSFRASIVVSGFLSYCLYLSLSCFLAVFEGHYPILIVVFLSLFGLSSLELYDFFYTMDFQALKQRFPGWKENLPPSLFLVLLVPLFCVVSFLKSFFYGHSADVEEAWTIVLKILHDFTEGKYFARFINHYFEIGPSTPAVTDALIVLPLCIFAAVLLLKRRPLGYLLTPILLVIIAVRSIYIIKIIPLLIGIMMQINEYQTYGWGRQKIMDEITVIIFNSQNTSWFLKFIPAFAALFIAWYFLKRIREDVPAVEKADPKARPEAPPPRPPRRKA